MTGMRAKQGDSPGVRCPLVAFECGHNAYIWPDECGDGSAWCQTCGAFRCYARCEICGDIDCDHRETM